MSRVVIGCPVAVLRSHWSAVPTPLFDNISQLLGDSFSVSQQPPICELPSHYSMVQPIKIITLLLLRFLHSAVSIINQLLLGYCLLLLCHVRSRIIYHPTNYEQRIRTVLLSSAGVKNLLCLVLQNSNHCWQ